MSKKGQPIRLILRPYYEVDKRAGHYHVWGLTSTSFNAWYRVAIIPLTQANPLQAVNTVVVSLSKRLAAAASEHFRGAVVQVRPDVVFL